jgi:cytochrome c-type biogenesis protein CcmH
MLFWTLAALLTLGASLAVLAPLTRRAPATSTPGDHDLEVYKDQLAELGRDAARGLIRPAEAEEARTEIARRILKLDASRAQDGAEAGWRLAVARYGGMAAVIAVPLVSWGLYGLLGSPDIPSQPLQARLSADPAKSSIDELVARAEAHLAANPEDGRGWDVLAPIYLRMGRYDDAVSAYAKAIRLEGGTARREAGLGEAIAGAGGGIVSDDAQKAFERALVLDPHDAKARFYLATGLAQDGRYREAIDGWNELIAALPPDSPWRGATQQALAEASKLADAPASENGAGETAATEPGSSGPTKEDMEAAASMSAGDRTAMIETMVAGLDEKLRQNPKDAEGWRRLIRSYVVLGKKSEARGALKRAVDVFGAGSAEAVALTDSARGFGLTDTE